MEAAPFALAEMPGGKSFDHSLVAVYPEPSPEIAEPSWTLVSICPSVPPHTGTVLFMLPLALPLLP